VDDAVGNSDKVQRFVTLSLNNFPVDLPASKLKEALDGVAGFVRSVPFVPVQLLFTSLRWTLRHVATARACLHAQPTACQTAGPARNFECQNQSSKKTGPKDA
jgi:hypothetical protein